MAREWCIWTLPWAAIGLIGSLLSVKFVAPRRLAIAAAVGLTMQSLVAVVVGLVLARHPSPELLQGGIARVAFQIGLLMSLPAILLVRTVRPPPVLAGMASGIVGLAVVVAVSRWPMIASSLVPPRWRSTSMLLRTALHCSSEVSRGHEWRPEVVWLSRYPAMHEILARGASAHATIVDEVELAIAEGRDAPAIPLMVEYALTGDVEPSIEARVEHLLASAASFDHLSVFEALTRRECKRNPPTSSTVTAIASDQEASEYFGAFVPLTAIQGTRRVNGVLLAVTVSCDILIRVPGSKLDEAVLAAVDKVIAGGARRIQLLAAGPCDCGEALARIPVPKGDHIEIRLVAKDGSIQLATVRRTWVK